MSVEKGEFRRAPIFPADVAADQLSLSTERQRHQKPMEEILVKSKGENFPAKEKTPLLKRELRRSGENSTAQERAPPLGRELRRVLLFRRKIHCSEESSTARERTPLSSTAQEKNSDAQEMRSAT
ncbi:hypothetical protein U1Q18_023564 [Sarracenia purpurea var. burkii]